MDKMNCFISLKFILKKWLFLRKVIDYPCGEDIVKEVGLTSTSGVFYLKDVFELVNDRLTYSPFS